MKRRLRRKGDGIMVEGRSLQERVVGMGLGLAAAGLLLLTCPGPALAGPGGLIKTATQSPIGRMIMAVLVLILLPVVLFFVFKRARAIRQTRRDLGALAAVHPQYQWLDIRDQVTAAYTWVWSAWSAEKLEKAGEFVTPWYLRNQQMLMDGWEARGLQNVCKLHYINSIQPLYVEHRSAHGVEGEGSRLVVLVSGLVSDFLKERESGKVVEGDRKSSDLEAVWTFLWQDGAWRLNQIEPGSMEFEYLFRPNILPAPAATAAPGAAG